MRKEIEAVHPDRLLNTAVDDLAAYFESKFRIDVPVLRADEIVVDQREKQIDVSRDPMRMVLDRSKPFYITGTEVEVEVPFDGEAEAFKIQPNPYTLTPPRAEIRGSTVVFRIVGWQVTMGIHEGWLAAVVNGAVVTYTSTSGVRNAYHETRS
jgi:hypothetical protein